MSRVRRARACSPRRFRATRRDPGDRGELFAETGFAATTVREIADAAGILSGSLYHHFDSKESMVDELVHEFLDGLAARPTAAGRRRGDDPVTTLRTLVRSRPSTAIGADRATVAVMVNEWNLLRAVPALRLPARDLTRRPSASGWACSNAARESGAFRPDLDPWMLYRMIRDAIWVSVRWYRPDGP